MNSSVSVANSLHPLTRRFAYYHLEKHRPSDLETAIKKLKFPFPHTHINTLKIRRPNIILPFPLGFDATQWRPEEALMWWNRRHREGEASVDKKGTPRDKCAD